MIFLSIAETTDILNISTKQVMSLIRSGQLQGYQFGQEVRVETDDLKQFIERAKIMGNSNDTNVLIMQVIEKASTYEAATEAVERILIDIHGISTRSAEGQAVKIVMASEHGKKLFEASEAGRAAKKAGNLYAF